MSDVLGWCGVVVAGVATLALVAALGYGVYQLVLLTEPPEDDGAPTETPRPTNSAAK